jgi:hypothetical protein
MFETFARFDYRVDETASRQYVIAMLQVMRPGGTPLGVFHF